MIINNKYYNQTEIFKLWIEENKNRFNKKPVMFEESDSYLTFKYEDIDNILVKVDNNSSIEIRVQNSDNEDNLLIDFFVILKEDQNNKYYNAALEEKDRKYYDIPEPIYYDEYNLFLKWSNEYLSKN